ncbi:unnamed protein product [Vicia faba]|uniref:Cytochrome P450 n=1 Tax=Vicia faba TaxID=3906 RepID=A0AAV1ABY3_VICFA|nr:unnamed protein product [Vicia faba]
MDNLFSPSTLALAISLVLVYNIWRIIKPCNKSKGKKPPQPSYSLPLIGHLHLLGNKIPLARIFASLSDKYGPIFQINLGAYPALVISNQEAIKECFTTNDKILASRPKSSHGIYLGYNFAGFGFAPYGPYWTKLRKLAMLELLSPRRIESLRHVYESEIDTLIKDLSLYVKDGKAKVVISEWLERLTFNIMTKMICGKRYLEYMQDVDDVEAHGKVLKSMKRVARDLDKVVGRWVEEHIEKSDDIDEKHDFIDVMLSVIEDDPVSGHSRDTIIKANVMNLMLAGSDTTSTTMTWMLAILLNNMNALKLVQEEIEHHIGPLLVPHEAKEDCNIQDYYIPKGTRVFVNVWKLHRDPSIWLEPEKFSPERFINEKGEIDHDGHHFEYLPFGLGRRACPGSMFATQVSLVTLACLIHSFDFEVSVDEVVDMREGLGITLPKLTPLQVLLTPRLPYELYQ